MSQRLAGMLTPRSTTYVGCNLYVIICYVNEGFHVRKPILAEFSFICVYETNTFCFSLCLLDYLSATAAPLVF